MQGGEVYERRKVRRNAHVENITRWERGVYVFLGVEKPRKMRVFLCGLQHSGRRILQKAPLPFTLGSERQGLWGKTTICLKPRKWLLCYYEIILHDSLLVDEFTSLQVDKEKPLPTPPKEGRSDSWRTINSVSYTHLTLPTN